MMNRKIAFLNKSFLYVGITSVFFLTVHSLMIAKIETVTSYFFIFSWWSYILLVDSIVLWKKRTSLISRLKAKFFLLIISSVCFWILFEIFNRRIANWHYPNLYLSTTELIIFGFLAFGSVLPGILETHELLQLIGLGRRLAFLQWEKTNKLLGWHGWGRPRYLWVTIGLIMILAAFLWPLYFFWIIWVALIFILDPIVDKAGGDSILLLLRKGNVRTLYRLLLTGLICGVLWEGWNYWAGLKWVYEVPFVGNWKFFEMPVLGYFGFTFFAVECYVFYQWLGCQQSRLKKIIKITKTKGW